MEPLFDKYKNIVLCATAKQYRGYDLIEPPVMDYVEFRKKMQNVEFVMHKFRNPRNDQQIDIFLFSPNSKVIDTSLHFKKMLDAYKGEHSLILVTETELSAFRKTTIRSYPNLSIKSYLHRHFIIEMNRGPLCSKHTILSVEDARQVCFDLVKHGHGFPVLLIDDPQNIWIGGEVNDVVRIDSYSETTGMAARYRIILPRADEVPEVKKPVKKVVAKKPVKKIPSKKSDAESDDDSDDEVDEVAEEIEEDVEAEESTYETEEAAEESDVEDYE